MWESFRSWWPDNQDRILLFLFQDGRLRASVIQSIVRHTEREREGCCTSRNPLSAPVNLCIQDRRECIMLSSLPYTLKFCGKEEGVWVCNIVERDYWSGGKRETVRFPYRPAGFFSNCVLIQRLPKPIDSNFPLPLTFPKIYPSTLNYSLRW